MPNHTPPAYSVLAWFAAWAGLLSSTPHLSRSMFTIEDPDQLLGDAVRQLARRRVRFAMSRFEGRLNTIRLTVRRDRSQPPGDQIVCHLFIGMHRADDVDIQIRDADVTTAIPRAIDRAGRAVARAIDRSELLSFRPSQS